MTCKQCGAPDGGLHAEECPERNRPKPIAKRLREHADDVVERWRQFEEFATTLPRLTEFLSSSDDFTIAFDVDLYREAADVIGRRGVEIEALRLENAQIRDALSGQAAKSSDPPPAYPPATYKTNEELAAEVASLWREVHSLWENLINANAKAAATAVDEAAGLAAAGEPKTWSTDMKAAAAAAGQVGETILEGVAAEAVDLGDAIERFVEDVRSTPPAAAESNQPALVPLIAYKFVDSGDLVEAIDKILGTETVVTDDELRQLLSEAVVGIRRRDRANETLRDALAKAAEESNK